MLFLLPSPVCSQHSCPAAAAAAKSLQSCATLCDPIDGSPPGFPFPGILQARTLEWVAIAFSNAWNWKVKVKSLTRARLFATPWTAAYQAPPSMGFSRQEYWSGVPLTVALVMVNTDNSFRIYFSQVKVKTYTVQHKLLLYNFFLLLFYLLSDIDPATLVSLSSRNMADMLLLEGLCIYCSLNLECVSQIATCLTSFPCSSFYSGVTVSVEPPFLLHSLTPFPILFFSIELFTI